MTVPPIDQYARERREDEHGNLSGECDDAEEQLRSGEAVHEPARGDARDPRSDQRDRLPAEEEAIVAMTKSAGDAVQSISSTQVVFPSGSARIQEILARRAR